MKNKIIYIFNYKLQTYVAFFYDVIISAFAFHLAWLLRDDQYKPKNYIAFLIISVLVQSLSYITNGLYKGIWRFSSVPDLARMIKAITIGVVLSMAILFLYVRLENIPRSVFFIEWFILIVFLGGGRFAYRIFKDFNHKKNPGKKTLIIGAGEAGNQLLRELVTNNKLDISVVGFIDDNPRKINKTLQGYPILGAVEDIQKMILKYKIEKVILAIPSASNEEVKRIFQICVKSNIEVQTLPSLAEMLNEKIDLTNLRKIKPEDLLGREIVSLDDKEIGLMISNQVVLVTGAAGSIGSELVRQIANFCPKYLVLIDASEFNTYNLDYELKNNFPKLNFSANIGDIRNKARMKEIFLQFNPKLVFHAAAYKHVPLMEDNPAEAFSTNVLGTQNICELCLETNVHKMILVSTDKAVNPTNIMGASKRVAELLCLMNQKKSQTTKFIAVRFGNVLGSSGSVIPRFKDQIANGGPLTVTHPQITRYFMSISEASQLILQAGSMGTGSDIFILEMGQSVKILELAEQMIAMAGLKPHIDIPITYSGLRPGEKLFEELSGNDEIIEKTNHTKVFRVSNKEFPPNMEQTLLKLLQDSGESIENKKQVLKELAKQ